MKTDPEPGRGSLSCPGFMNEGSNENCKNRGSGSNLKILESFYVILLEVMEVEGILDVISGQHIASQQHTAYFQSQA